jgi:serralysin
LLSQLSEITAEHQYERSINSDSDYLLSFVTFRAATDRSTAHNQELLMSVQAISAIRFITSLGVNTHIDFANYGYQNLSTVEAAIKYLGVTNLRDSAQSTTDATTWLQVAQATGAKFDNYIGETSPAGMQTDLNLMPQLAQEGILNYIEGGNEEDDAYPASLGNTLQITAQFQQSVWAMGQQLGLPVINMSFGSGWTSTNNWQGDYDKVGDLSAYASYANAHTYPNPGQLPDDTIQRLNGLANLAAASRPVITTEVGWDENLGFTQAQIARYALDATMDGIKDGDVKMYFYALFNDGSGNFGLMNADGTAKPAGTAIHNLTTLLADTGANAASFTPGSLSYTLSGTQSGDNSLLIEKSDGSFWLSLWNETEAAGSPHNVTLTLPAAAEVKLFDPLTGTAARSDVTSATTATISLPDHPVLVEILPSSGSSSSGSPSPTDLALVLPAAKTVSAGTTATFSGISISDPWAATATGAMTLNVWDSTGAGTITIAGHTSVGTGWVSLTGTLSQLNADLAALSYKAGSNQGSDGVTIDVLNQAGVDARKTLAVTIGSAGSTSSPSDLAVVLPAAETVTAGSTMSFSGISISDPWAAAAAGGMALNVWDSTGAGTITIAGHTSVGTGWVSLSGSLSQLNADLAALSYKAGSNQGSDGVTIDVWNQAGVEVTKTLGVTVAAATTPPSSSTITIAATDANPVVMASYVNINATSGDHMLFIGGTHDKAILTGGRETVQAYQGYNTISTGGQNDTIKIGGSGNRVYAGGGHNVIEDGGSLNTIVLSRAGIGFDDVYGYVLQGGDKFDLRSALSATTWDGQKSTLTQYLSVGTSGNDATISMRSTVGGTAVALATLHDSGALTMTGLLMHSIV